MLRTTTAALLALTMAACASEAPAPQSAEREIVVTRMATVVDIDRENRQILLERTDGKMLSVTAGPEVRNLDQLEPGDVVRSDYYEAISVKMANPSDTSPPEGTVVAGRSPEGAKPGVAAGESVRMIVDFISYDPATAIATFRTPDDMVHTAHVEPDMRAFAAGLETGDRVDLTMTKATAITIDEVNG